MATGGEMPSSGSVPLGSHRDDFSTNAGIKVSVVKADITAIPADCIVRFVDEKLQSADRTAIEISNALGKISLNEKSLEVSKVSPSIGGDRWKHAVHACLPPYKPDGPVSAQDLQHLEDTIFNCFMEAHKLKCKTIALPTIHPSKECTERFLAAITKFDDTDFGEEETTLTHIMVVDPDQETVEEFVNIMSKSNLQKQKRLCFLFWSAKAGVGKSKTGNSIIRQVHFTVAKSLKAITEKSGMGSYKPPNVPTLVVDTPGLFESGEPGSVRSKMKEILKCVLYCLPGPHVFILVLSGGTRFTKEDEKVYTKCKEMFSEDIKRYLIIVFTHVWDDKELQDLIEDSPQYVKDMIKDCNNRVLGIDNGDREKPPRCEQQVEAIIKKALEVREENRKAHANGLIADGSLCLEFYTNALLNVCVQVIESNNPEMPLEDIKKEADKAIMQLYSNKKVREEAKKTEKNCCIIS